MLKFQLLLGVYSRFLWRRQQPEPAPDLLQAPFILSSCAKRRIYATRRLGIGSAFITKYKLDRLVYFERFKDVHRAIGRAKEIKGWLRIKKVARVASNPGRMRPGLHGPHLLPCAQLSQPPLGLIQRFRLLAEGKPHLLRSITRIAIEARSRHARDSDFLH